MGEGMNNFYRVITISFRHRFTVAASLFCSLAVAVLWGGNITAIYPIVDVVIPPVTPPDRPDVVDPVPTTPGGTAPQPGTQPVSTPTTPAAE